MGLDGEEVPRKGDKSETSKEMPRNAWNWKEHIPLLISGFSIAFIAIRLISISNGEFETAVGILQASGTTTVVIGALIPTIGAITIILVPLIIAMMSDGTINKSSRPPAIALVVSLLVISYFLSPALIILPAGVLVIYATQMPGQVRAERRHNSKSKRVKSVDSKRALRNIFRIGMWGVFVIAVSVTAVSPVPWLPAERITPTSMPPFSGYVIDETDTDVTILTLHTREILHMKPDEITSRSVCRISGVHYGGFVFETPSQFLTGNSQAHYPLCRN